MQTAERVERILERVRRDGRIYTAALAAEYGVSEETIRRDIRALAREGKLKRVHGASANMRPGLSATAISSPWTTAAARNSLRSRFPARRI